MQPTSNTPASPIQLPQVDTDEPVAVIPLASVAPLDDAPAGERINTFALRSRESDGPFADFADLADKARDSVRANPLLFLVLAFSAGCLLARARR